METGRPLPGALLSSTVQTQDGNSAPLASFIPEKPTALVFIRHFGCLGCSVHMADLAPRLDELHRLGLRVVLVGNGDARFIAGFLARFKLPAEKVTVVTDPSLKTHAAALLRRSAWGTFGPRGLLDQIRALLTGHRQTNIQGDNLQQGGAILIDQDGQVVYYHRNESISDHAKTSALVDAIYKLLMNKDPLYS